jgi:predicted naringenin-chalcone synthase
MSPDPGCYVHQIGTAVPEQSLSSEEGLRLLKDGCINRRSERLLQRVIPLTGIEKRYLAALDFQQEDNRGESLYRPIDEQPGGPGMSARTRAFQEAADPLVRRALSAFTPDVLAEIGTLVTVSCTHASSPGLEAPVFRHTPVPPTVDRWNLGFMGCSAALAAMRLLSRTHPLDRGSLILACELSSLHFQYTDALDQMTANLLFSDGAAAITLSSRPSLIRVMGCRCVALPAASHQMVWFAGDHGLHLTLSPELADTLAADLPAVVEVFLRDQSLSIQKIDHWIVHPGGPQILDSVERSLGLPADALELSRSVLRHYGNMSSPTILFIMEALFASGAEGDTVAMAFGPGLTIELAHLRLDRRDSK